jgi:nitrite reductase/ring-hydroxylating ferredoxin subunit
MTERAFHPAAELDEFASANPLRKEVNGWPLLIIRDGEEIHAFYNLCTHVGVQMNAAHTSEGTIVCPYHRARFDLRTGRCLNSMRVVGIADGLPPLTRFETRLVGDRVLVALPPTRTKQR